MKFLRTWFSGREISVLGHTWCGFPRPKPGNFLDMIFKTWDPQFFETWSLHSGFPRLKKTWEILGYGFQDMVFRTWDLNFEAWIFTLAVSKTKTWKLLGFDFQDVESQFWDLDFTHGASHDPGLGIFLTHDFQDMDGEPGDFTMSEGHEHPLVVQKLLNWVKEWGKYGKVFDDKYMFDDGWFYLQWHTLDVQ